MTFLHIKSAVLQLKILILMQSTLPIFLSQITLFYFFTPEFLSGLKHPDVLSSWDWLHPSLLKRVNKLINPQSKASFFSFFQADYSNLLICFYLFIHSFIFRLCWVFVAAWAGPFSSCSERGLLSSCSAWDSHCSGFSCDRAQAPGPSGLSSCGAQA